MQGMQLPGGAGWPRASQREIHPAVEAVADGFGRVSAGGRGEPGRGVASFVGQPLAPHSGRGGLRQREGRGGRQWSEGEGARDLRAADGNDGSVVPNAVFFVSSPLDLHVDVQSKEETVSTHFHLSSVTSSPHQQNAKPAEQ